VWAIDLTEFGLYFSHSGDLPNGEFKNRKTQNEGVNRMLQKNNKNTEKNTRPYVGRIALLRPFIAVIGVISLALTGVTVAQAAPKKITIGIAMKTQLQERWTFDLRAMQAVAKAEGVTLKVQWANDDAALQASQIENLLSQGINALIVIPVDDRAVGSSVKKARAQKVPVISYDIGVRGTQVDFFVIRNNPQVGVLQAKGAIAFAGSNTNFALIEGDAANDVAQAIHTAHLATLKGTPIKIVYDQFTKNWDPATAQSQAENILSANDNKIGAFLTANDGMAGGVIQALKGAGLAGKVYVSGLDATPSALKLILEGSMNMSVWTPIDQQGKIAMRTAISLAKGEKVKPDAYIENGSGSKIPTKTVQVISITKKNVCNFINRIAPAGWVKASDVYADPKDCLYN
jgi:D-xylose transport system substrate-binding protein